MKDPLPTFTTFIGRVCGVHPNVAYIHVVEPLFDGITDSDLINQERGNRPYIAAGGMDGAMATNTVEV